MWKYVLPPVIFIAVLWIAMGTATTTYMNWVESSYDQVIKENLASIQFADAIQDCLKRLEIILPADDKIEASTANATRMLPFWKLLVDELNSGRVSLEKTAYSQKERDQLKSCDQLFEELRSTGNQLFAPDMASAAPGGESTIAPSITSTPITSLTDSRIPMLAIKQRLNELANQINASMASIKSINRELSDASAKERSKWGRWVGLLRTGLHIFGPLFGVFFGWRLTRRLQKSVTRIAVTLKQANDQTLDLGELVIQPSAGELGYMQHQSEMIVKQLKQVHFDLDTTRREVTRSERLASVGRLAAGVAHELRNPLTSVKLLLQNAMRKGRIEMLTPDKVELILEEVSRMESTIEGLLDFSRERPIQATPHNILETVQRALNLVSGHAEQNRIEIRFEKPNRPLLVHGDRELLHQVFVNLILNAIESMPDGGTLSIVATDKNEQRVRITVRDTGPGISAEVLPHLFEPFTTTKERGTGLGLAISRRIVDQHAGLLTAENAPEGGALFSLELPTPTQNAKGT